MKIVIKVPKPQVGILEGQVYEAELATPFCKDCMAINLKDGDKAILFPEEYIVLGNTKPKSKIQKLLTYLGLRF